MACMEQLIQVEAIAQDQFVGRVGPGKSVERAFGGHVVAQALSSAVKTIEDPKFLIQSLHCYYNSAVKTYQDVIYHVTRLKDGRTISTRGVRATQGAKTVFSCLVSFSVEEKEDLGLTHTDCPMPEVEQISQGIDVCVAKKSSGTSTSSPMEYVITRLKNSDMSSNEARMYSWNKPKKEIKQDSQNVHRIVLSYASDFGLPLVIFFKYPDLSGLMTTSLDHSIWFHENVDFNQWHLFARECIRSAHGCPLNILRIYNKAGTLVATAMQQSLVRAKL